MSRKGIDLLSVCICLAAGPRAEAQENSRDLSHLSIEELMQIEVTSVSKKEVRLSEAPAAVHVITQEDIRRSGHRRIPELLRMVPGLEVARIDANKWAITARGFNGRFANKLLVLIDGRSVYTPLFSGVYWDVQDTLIEDVERIEVIRGPGATLWGANAVNGVINIITKQARETQGGLVAGGGGSEELAFGGVRYGGKVGDKVHYRAYLKYYNHDDFVDASNRDTADEWDMLRGGFRLDWDPTPADLITLQGDLYGGEVGSRSTVVTTTSPFSRTFNDEVDVYGGDLLGRWTHEVSESSQMALQLYYDRAEREDAIVGQTHDTIDLDLQHRFARGRHELSWGLGYRVVLDELRDGPSVSFEPRRQDFHLLSAFLQDEVTLVKNRLRLTVGSKLEYNDYTAFEFQPSGRLLWTPHARHTAWAAVSRAVRTPSRAENDIRIVSGASALGIATVNGNDRLPAEELLAFELGYRVLPFERLSLDLAAFFNRYENVLGLEGRPLIFPPPFFVAPSEFDNKMDGEAYGVEASANLEVTRWWKLTGGFGFFRLHLHDDSTTTGTLEDQWEGANPRHQAMLRSSMNLPGNLDLDLLLYYVDHLPQGDIPSYIRLDARLGWRPRKDLELSVGVKDALDDRHPEFGSEIFTNPTEVERAVYGAITWRF